MLKCLGSRFFRRKTFDGEEPSKLARCLTTLDLTLLGIGSTLGVGVYVLAGGVARSTAGPSVVLSFIIAGFASALSGLCYAEFGARVPKAGSAYVYSYVTVGELVGFVIGWNLILEYVIGTASVARGYSGYLDSMLNNSMQQAYNDSMHMHAPFLAEYPDFTAFFITILLSIVLSYGVQESTRFNNVFTVLNLLVVMFVVVTGITQSRLANWYLPPRQGKDAGGFFPFGFSGTLSGAATCFYGFVGFDAIATTGEETKNPQKSIPIAIIVSLAFICLSYIGISTVLTLMIPYYLQDPAAPLPHVFHEVGLPWAGWVVSVGALFGLSTSLLGAMFPLPRVLYAMASDGLIPRPLATVHKRFQTPLLATLLAGFGAAFMALLFDLAQLVDMMSIGTLMAYTMVGVCVLLLHYQDETLQAPDGPSYSPLSTADDTNEDSDEDLFTPEELGSRSRRTYTWVSYTRQLINLDGLSAPTQLSGKVAHHNIVLFALLTIPWSVVMTREMTMWNQISLVAISVKMIVCLAVIYMQPQAKSLTTFVVPAVPWLPAVSVVINVFLMCKLSVHTWVRFVFWMAGGFLIYGCYGWRNSSEEYRMNGRLPPGQGKDIPLHERKHDKNDNY